ncbi:MAG: hypothetical protein OXB88_05410 [Bacteriovoracales bacterium]|nr:hypothetical protein [Bacteriovoracales bacterium]
MRFWKKKSSIALRYLVGISLLLILSFYAGCDKRDYYSCVHEKTGEEVEIGWSRFMGMEWNSTDFPPWRQFLGFSPGQYSNELNADKRGGSYNIAFTDEYAEVNRIQDVVLSRLQLPDGKIVNEDAETFYKHYCGKYRPLHRIYILIPTLITGRLYFEKKVFEKTSSFLQKPRKAHKTKLNTKKISSGYCRVLPGEKKQISEGEFRQNVKDFVDPEKTTVTYQCEEIFYPFKRIGLWMAYLLFGWF